MPPFLVYARQNALHLIALAYAPADPSPHLAAAPGQASAPRTAEAALADAVMPAYPRTSVKSCRDILAAAGHSLPKLRMLRT